jgi:hypothetical protein
MTPAARTQAPAGVLALIAMAALAPCPARAQLLGQYFPVGIPGHESWVSAAAADRPRTAYDTLGIRAGTFVVRPSLSETFGYDSNVADTPRAVGSAVAETQGRLAAAADWSRDALNAEIGFDDVRYPSDTGASRTDWTAALGAVRDIGRDRASLAYTHVTATATPTQIGTTAGPAVVLALDTMRAGYAASLGRLVLEPAFEADFYRYTHGAGDPQASDRDIFAGSLTGSYAVAPGRSLVLVANAAHAGFTDRIAGLPAADYDDASLVGGIDWGGALLRARATLGYETRSYGDARLPGTAAPLAEVDAIWTPTRLTTVTGQISHSLQDAVAAGGAENFAYTVARLAVDHDYARNLLVQGFAQWQTAAYQDRGTQRVVSGGASVTWRLTRKLSVIGRVSYARSTDGRDTALSRTGGFAGLTLAFHP